MVNNFLVDIIDQIDLSIDQLAIKDINYDRFALMLVDNAMELILNEYTFAQPIRIHDHEKTNNSKGSEHILAKANSRFFADKVQYARDTGLINDIECDAIKNLHEFRNKTYHQGFQTNNYLHSLAVVYLRCTCTVLCKYRPSYFSVYGSYNISHRVRKYLGKFEFLDGWERYQQAFERLLCVAEFIQEDLVSELYADMINTIENSDESIQLLADCYSRKKIQRDKIIAHIQAWEIASSEKAKSFAENNGCKETIPEKFVEWLAYKYKWEFRGDPITGWMRKAGKMKNETNQYLVLKMYSDFMRQTEGFREFITRESSIIEHRLSDWED